MTAQAELFELPAELAIDAGVARRVIVEFIRGQLRQDGFEKLVLGLSGGIDSALVAYLSAEAIGADRLLCVLMPYRTSSEASLVDARSVVDALGCASEVVDISPMVDAYFATDPDATPLRRGNYMARQRMAVLYDRSVTWGGLVDAYYMYLFNKGGDSGYRLHGTPEWWSIGKAMSSGCIRLMNQDIIDLYDRAEVGAKVIVR